MDRKAIISVQLLVFLLILFGSLGISHANETILNNQIDVVYRFMIDNKAVPYVTPEERTKKIQGIVAKSPKTFEDILKAANDELKEFRNPYYPMYIDGPGHIRCSSVGSVE